MSDHAGMTGHALKPPRAFFKTPEVRERPISIHTLPKTTSPGARPIGAPREVRNQLVDIDNMPGTTSIEQVGRFASRYCNHVRTGCSSVES
jgi:hypothetical protein